MKPKLLLTLAAIYMGLIGLTILMSPAVVWASALGISSLDCPSPSTSRPLYWHCRSELVCSKRRGFQGARCDLPRQYGSIWLLGYFIWPPHVHWRTSYGLGDRCYCPALCPRLLRGWSRKYVNKHRLGQQHMLYIRNRTGTKVTITFTF